MSKHILDRTRLMRNRRVLRRYLALEKTDSSNGLSGKIIPLDRARKLRKSRQVAAFTAIERGRKP